MEEDAFLLFVVDRRRSLISIRRVVPAAAIPC